MIIILFGQAQPSGMGQIRDEVKHPLTPFYIILDWPTVERGLL